MTFSSSSNSPFHLFTNDQNDISETQFLKNSIVSHTKYGSTNHNSGPSQNYRYITHFVDASDTLQGLSLKYGCKIETLKKHNKLYSDDNNYLRSRVQLLIPIEISIETGSNIDSDISSAQTSSSSLETKDVQLSFSSVNHNTVTNHNNVANNINKAPKHSQSFDQNSNKSSKAPNKSISICDPSSMDSEESFADFLIRIDSSIAKTKNMVHQMSTKIGNNSLEEELNKVTSKRFGTPKPSSERAVLTSSASSRSLFDSDLPSVSMSKNRSRKVKSSMKMKMEKSHDEIYEL